ncbi:MAG: hypothetical protein ACP5LI_05910 [Hydrogenobaculum sp.]
MSAPFLIFPYIWQAQKIELKKAFLDGIDYICITFIPIFDIEKNDFIAPQAAIIPYFKYYYPMEKENEVIE